MPHTKAGGCVVDAVATGVAVVVVLVVVTDDAAGGVLPAAAVAATALVDASVG